MALTFPCRPNGYVTPGTPERADHCRCGDQAMHHEPGETCSRCGHYPRDVISDTWSRRARQVARRRAAA